MKKSIVAITTFVASGLIAFSKPALSNAKTPIIIFRISGNVQIKRPSWTKYQRAFDGTLVNSSDKLRLAKGASAKVRCTYSWIWNVPSPGESSVSQGCPNSKPVLRRPNSNTLPTRAGDDPTIPYLISPRNSSILTDKPQLRWNPVEGVTNYKVQLSGPGVDWQTEVNQPQVVYSGKQPLKPGNRYWVIITADNGETRKNDKAGFTLMSEADSQRVKAEIAKLEQQGLKGEAKTIALAHLYRSNDLYGDAIDLLSGFIQKDNASTAVYQLLGSTYQQVRLNLLAREQYLTALKSAKIQKNWEAQAIIQTSLGEIDFSFNKFQEALGWYQAAQVAYRELGDRTSEEKLQEKINQTKERI